MSDDCIYTITVKRKKSGGLSIVRVNDGFNAFEILGFIEKCKSDLLDIIAGNTEVDEIKRQVIIDEDNPNK